MFVVQSALLLAIALIIGCVAGYLLRLVFAPVPASQTGTGKPEAAGATQKVASVPPQDALAGAPIPPPTRILEEKTAKKSRTSAKPAKAKPQTAARKAKATPKKPASKAKATAAKPAPAKQQAKPAASAENGRPPAIAKPARPDDLTKISGIGPKIAATLNGLGIYRWSQIADWKKTERDWVNTHLSFKGRVEREDWVKQAKLLAKPGAAKK